MPSFFSKLKQRNVFRVAGVYAVVGWLLAQVATTLESSLSLPAWFDSFVVSLLLLGFPLALVFAWAFELTPDGIRRSEDVSPELLAPQHAGKRLDGLIVFGLLVVAGLIIWSWWQVPALAPEDRAQSFEDAIADIAAEATRDVTEQSIAVLPFADMSAAGDQEYFSDGIAEEILNALVRVPDLKVSGRTSSFAFKGRNIDIREIAAALGVSTVLEGSVRKQGERVRITAQLIRAEDGFHLWSEVYDGTLEDVFDLQDRIARQIAHELEPLFSPVEGDRLAPRLTENTDAYDLYLRGTALLWQFWGRDELTQSLALLEQAVALDPGFVEAKAALAGAYYTYPTYVVVEDEFVYLRKSEAMTREVLAINPNHAAAHFGLASLAVVRGELLKSFHLRLKARELMASPLVDSGAMSEAHSEFLRAFELAMIGHIKASKAHYERSIALDPTVGQTLHNYANTLAALGEIEAAERMNRRAEAVGFAGSAGPVAEMMKRQGKADEAVAYMVEAQERLQAYVGEPISKTNWLIYAKALFTQDLVARRLYRAYLLNLKNGANPRGSTPLLAGLKAIGEPELFMQAYEELPYTNRGYMLTHVWDSDENARKIRTHPDFPAWADRIGLVEVWKEYGTPDLCSWGEDVGDIVCQ